MSQDRRPWIAGLMTVIGVCVALFAVVRSMGTLEEWGLPRSAIALGLLLVVAVGVSIGAILPLHRAYARAYRRAVRELGHAACIGCGSALDDDRGLARCPTCGANGEPPSRSEGRSGGGGSPTD